MCKISLKFVQMFAQMQVFFVWQKQIGCCQTKMYNRRCEQRQKRFRQKLKQRPNCIEFANLETAPNLGPWQIPIRFSGNDDEKETKSPIFAI